MATKAHTKTSTKDPSLLDQFKLSYEYNETWSDAKKAIRSRTQR